LEISPKGSHLNHGYQEIFGIFVRGGLIGSTWVQSCERRNGTLRKPPG